MPETAEQGREKGGRCIVVEQPRSNCQSSARVDCAQHSPTLSPTSGGDKRPLDRRTAGCPLTASVQTLHQECFTEVPVGFKHVD